MHHDLIRALSQSIDLAANLVLAGGLFVVVLRLALSRQLQRARVGVAHVLTLALSIKSASSILNTVLIDTWEGVGTASLILVLRLIIGAEAKWLSQRHQPKY